jgi:hypothetical protein
VLLVVLALIAFGSEVSRAAHRATSARRSENLSFATIATTVLDQENSFDAQLASLLSSGSNLTRVAFAVQLSDLSQDLSQWRDDVQLLKVPVLSPALNLTLADETATRVTDFDTVLNYVAQALDLSGPDLPLGAPTLGEAQLSLSTTAASWGEQRHELATAPGAVTLMALTDVSARLSVPQDVSVLATALNLAPTRAIVISAIQVQPAPFPAAKLQLLLEPTTTFQVQVAVTNLREIVQAVTLTLILTSSTGHVEHASMSHTLSPLSSYAFDAHTFAVTPGEKGTLSVTLNGVPASATLLHQRTYQVSVSPSVTG